MTAGGAAGRGDGRRGPGRRRVRAINTQQYGVPVRRQRSAGERRRSPPTRGIVAPFAGLTPGELPVDGPVRRHRRPGQLRQARHDRAHRRDGDRGVARRSATTRASTSARTSRSPCPGPAPSTCTSGSIPSPTRSSPASPPRPAGRRARGPTSAAPISVPAGWFTDPSRGLAVGIISTSNGPAAVPRELGLPPRDAGDLPPPPPPGGGDIAQDNFTRTVAGGWGCAQTGGPGLSAGPAADFAVAGAGTDHNAERRD